MSRVRSCDGRRSIKGGIRISHNRSRQQMRPYNKDDGGRNGEELAPATGWRGGRKKGGSLTIMVRMELAARYFRRARPMELLAWNFSLVVVGKLRSFERVH